MKNIEIVARIIIGTVAGWLASIIYKGSGKGVIRSIVIGIIVSFIGSWFLVKLGISLGSDLIGAILTAASEQ